MLDILESMIRSHNVDVYYATMAWLDKQPSVVTTPQRAAILQVARDLFSMDMSIPQWGIGMVPPEHPTIGGSVLLRWDKERAAIYATPSGSLSWFTWEGDLPDITERQHGDDSPLDSLLFMKKVSPLTQQWVRTKEKNEAESKPKEP